MYLRTNVALVLLSLTTWLGAQVSFTYQVTNASCSSNGSIQIIATGGTGTLTYQLSGSCLPLPVLQQTPIFNNLAPCQYTITVTDGGSGASATQNATVSGNYQSPDLSIFCGSCSIEAQVTGGLAPFTFSYSTTGLNGPFQDNQPPSNATVGNIQSGTSYWIKVTDACGNVAVETCQTGEGSLMDFSYEIALDGMLHVISVTGGNGTIQYSLSSTAGTFTSNTGIFPPSQWGCNMSLTVTDGCSSLSKPITVRPKILSICTNFTEGTATLGEVVNGIAPFIFRYLAPDGTIIATTTNELTGLPINFQFYQLQVIDACGNASEPIYKQKKSPVFEQTPVSCGNNSISLYTPNGGCNGGFDIDSWPFEVTCLSCTPVEVGVVDTSGVPITFIGNLPGNWEFSIEDGCGDGMTCKDSIMLLLEKRCDSIQASLVNRFFCDNGAISDRPMNASGGVFTLLDENGNVLGTNTDGQFYIVDSGLYAVKLTIPNCGTFSNTVTAGFWESADPVMNAVLYNAVFDGVCQPLYQLTIDVEQGPFYLTGGPNNISQLIDQGEIASSCRYYTVSNLYPGDYELYELDKCGSKMLHLPKPVYDLQAIPFGNCPGSGTITVSGASNGAGWQAWALANNATISISASIIDNYSLDDESNGALSFQSGSHYVFVNVEAGDHTVYLYALGSTCPVDTVVVNVPEAEPIGFDASNGIVCDGNSTTTLSFEILSGKPPYTLEQVNCNNPTQVIATHHFSTTTFDLPGFSFGDYCFRLIDSCITSLDHQFSVQYLQDDIVLEHNCDNTFTLSVDSLNATYQWFNSNGVLLGNSHKITVPNPSMDASYVVKVDIGECVITRTILVPATEIVPSLELMAPVYFCQGDIATLEAVTNATNFAWSTGDSAQSISTGVEGLYSLTVTNGFGCTATAEHQLILDIPVAEIQALSGGNGFGLNCFQDSNGVLVVNPLVGVGPYSFVWSTEDTINTIANLKVGNYGVIMTDSIGCKDTVSFELTEPELFVPFFEGNAPRCFGTEDGVIEVPSWTGGVGGVKAKLEATVPRFAPVVYDNLPPGYYALSVYDANGCQVDTSFFFPLPQELFVELGADPSIELGDSIHLAPTISFLPVDSFAWTSNDARPILELSAWVTPLESSYYSLAVWDENGCLVEDKLHVTVNKNLAVYAPTAFSPNGDGNNDFFTLYAKPNQVTSIKSLRVFSRFGELVFWGREFDPNVEQLSWDGTLDGHPLNPAVFVWKAEIELVDGSIEVLYGDVVLVR